MIRNRPGDGPGLRRGGEVWISFAGKCLDSASRKKQIWQTWVPVLMCTRYSSLSGSNG